MYSFLLFESIIYIWIIVLLFKVIVIFSKPIVTVTLLLWHTRMLYYSLTISFDLSLYLINYHVFDVINQYWYILVFFVSLVLIIFLYLHFVPLYIWTNWDNVLFIEITCDDCVKKITSL